jgi:hypothetical protein
MSAGDPYTYACTYAHTDTNTDAGTNRDPDGGTYAYSCT